MVNDEEIDDRELKRRHSFDRRYRLRIDSAALSAALGAHPEDNDL